MNPIRIKRKTGVVEAEVMESVRLTTFESVGQLMEYLGQFDPNTAVTNKYGEFLSIDDSAVFVSGQDPIDLMFE